MSRNQKDPQGYKSRKANTKEVRQTFLIVCQGAETETKYFESFQVSRKVKSKAVSPTQIVELAVSLRQEDDYDQVWCVFDRDSFPNFNAAIELANKEGMKVAYSNEAFELWYVLHFEFLNTGIPRSDYEKKLTQSLGHKYQKNSNKIYDEILELQPTALKNAERLLAEYNPINPEQNNPSTTVHLLVSELNRFIR